MTTKRSFLRNNPIPFLLVMIVGAVVLWLVWLFVGANFVRSHAAGQGRLFAPAEITQKQSPATPTGASGVTTNQTQGPVAASGANAEATRVPVDRSSDEGAKSNLGELGLSGDMFGSLNGLLAALTVVVVLWAGWLQTISLDEARTAIKDQMDAMSRQHFADLFFRVVERTDSALRVVRKVRHPLVGLVATEEIVREGIDALESYANSCAAVNGESDPELAGQYFVHQNEHMLRAAVSHYKRNVYDPNPSKFGPYFRMLFRQFKLIEESNLSEEDKLGYAKIARGQISEGTVFVLALNALTKKGGAFVPYIEKYGLLEHLHEKYMSKFGPLLRLAFHPTAFLGAADRIAQQNAPRPDPGCAGFDRSSWPEGYAPKRS